MGMLRRADRDRYGQLVIDLENQHTFGTDKYPTSMTDTYALLTNYKKPRLQQSRGRNHIDNAPPPTGEEGMTFVQRAAEPPIEEVQCYNCQQLGHYAGRCTNPYVPRARPEPEPVTGVQFLQETITPMEESTEDGDENSDTDLDFTFAQTMETDRKLKVDQNWVLLDSESTVNIFSNPKFLKNIRHCGNAHGLRIHTNGGPQDTFMV